MLLLVFNHHVLRRGHFGLISKEGLDLVSSAVSGSIVNEDNMIVSIVLHEDRLDLVDVPVALRVVVAWNDNAERKLLVLAY